MSRYSFVKRVKKLRTIRYRRHVLACTASVAAIMFPIKKTSISTVVSLSDDQYVHSNK